MGEATYGKSVAEKSGEDPMKRPSGVPHTSGVTPTTTQRSDTATILMLAAGIAALGALLVFGPTLGFMGTL